MEAPAYLRRPSLYVGDLSPTVTENDLGQVFGQCGQILSLRICRDRISGDSLRYGYVNFVYSYHAALAIACLNHTMLKGKHMRIMWSERDPHKRKTGEGNLFVKNLAPFVTNAHLEKIFRNYGTILSCKVAEDAAGKSKGFGFVQFNSVHSSMAAIGSLNGTMLAGKKLYVSEFLKKNERRDAQEDPKFTELYVKNLGGYLTYSYLKENFSRFGEIRSIRMIRDACGKLKRYAFVRFEYPNDAKAAMETLNGAKLDPGRLFVDKATESSKRKELPGSEHKGIINYVYVKNLHSSIGDKELKEYFNYFGKVTSAKVMRFKNGKSKGFGVVNFSSPEEANSACNAFHDTFSYGKPPFVSKAEPIEHHQRKMQNYHAFTPQFYPTYSVLPVYPTFNTASYSSFSKSESQMNPSTQSYQQIGFTYIPVQVQQSEQHKGTYTTASFDYPIKNHNAVMPTRKAKGNWNAVRKGHNHRFSAKPSKTVRCLSY